MTTQALVTFLLVAARLSGVVLALPVTMGRAFPALAKLALVLTLTIVVAPVVPPAPAAPSLGLLLVGVAGEVVVGIALGGLVQIPFAAFATAADAVAGDLGQAAGRMFDPTAQTTQTSLGVLANLLAGAVWLGADQHLMALAAVVQTFEVLPVATATHPWRVAAAWVPAFGAFLGLVVQLAGPILALSLLLHAFNGVMARLAPQMNVFFSVGMIANTVVGLACFALFLGAFLAAELAATERATLSLVGIAAQGE